MTLHNAIEIVLKEIRKPLNPLELALIINERKLYVKKDNSKIESSQISARVNKYPFLFYKKSGMIYLCSLEENQGDNATKQINRVKNKTKKSQVKTKKVIGNPSQVEFLIKNKFENLGNFSQLLTKGLPENDNLKYCGIYAISIPIDYNPIFISPENAVTQGNIIRPWTIEKLQNKWVSNSDVVYYGLAGKSSFRSLRKRLFDLFKHGNGNISDRGPHKGGEIIWQLEDYFSFSLWIMPTNGPPEPREMEKNILKTFCNIIGKLPFANRQF